MNLLRNDVVNSKVGQLCKAKANSYHSYWQSHVTIKSSGHWMDDRQKMESSKLSVLFGAVVDSISLEDKASAMTDVLMYLSSATSQRLSSYDDELPFDMLFQCLIIDNNTSTTTTTTTSSTTGTQG